MPVRNVVPKPLQKPHPPLWGATSSADGHREIGRHGIGLCSFTVGVPPEDLGERIGMYREGLNECEKPVGKFVNDRAATFTMVHCADTNEHAFADAEESFPWYIKTAVRHIGSLVDWMEGKDLGTYSYAEHMKELLPHEKEAVRIQFFSSSAVPGLLQTEPYAWALTRKSLPGASDSEISARVSLRIDRQQVLVRPEAPYCWGVIDEAVLTRPLAAKGAMLDQLQHLEQFAANPRNTFQIVPNIAGLHGFMGGSLALLHLEDGRTVALVESFGPGEPIENPARVAFYSEMYDAVKIAALPPDDSLKLISRYVKEYEVAITCLCCTAGCQRDKAEGGCKKENQTETSNEHQPNSISLFFQHQAHIAAPIISRSIGNLGTLRRFDIGRACNRATFGTFDFQHKLPCGWQRGSLCPVSSTQCTRFPNSEGESS
jgi:hypothetical protein